MVLLSTARKASLRAPTLARSLATPSSANIGQTKVQMSAFDKGHSINYQRIEDNLQVVRSRSVSPLISLVCLRAPGPPTPHHTRLHMALPPLDSPARLTAITRRRTRTDC